MQGLKATLARSDVSEAEKFRQLLQAYQIEAEYGNRLDAYSAELTLDGTPRRVEVLAVGRVALLAMTADHSLAWRWSAQQKTWLALDEQWLSPLGEAFAMAKRRASPVVATAALRGPAGDPVMRQLPFLSL